MVRQAKHQGVIRRQSTSKAGQSMLEYTVLVAAVASALVLMTDYIRQAFNANAQSIEEELNGATEDNKP